LAEQDALDGGDQVAEEILIDGCKTIANKARLPDDLGLNLFKKLREIDAKVAVAAARSSTSAAGKSHFGRLHRLGN
jgi:hypothetical protein